MMPIQNSAEKRSVKNKHQLQPTQDIFPKYPNPKLFFSFQAKKNAINKINKSEIKKTLVSLYDLLNK